VDHQRLQQFIASSTWDYAAVRRNVARSVAELAAGLAPGSLIAISHLTADMSPGPVAAAAAASNERVPVAFRGRGCASKKA
jgi:hypothetical protein